MKELIESDETKTQKCQKDCLEVFSVIHDFRQLVGKKRRRILRKVNAQRKRMMEDHHSEDSNIGDFEFSQHLNNYYSNQPWDILNEEVSKPQSSRIPLQKGPQNGLKQSEHTRRKIIQEEMTSPWPKFGLGIKYFHKSSFLFYTSQTEIQEFVTNH